MHGGRKYGMMDYSNAMQCIRKERMNMYITCLDVEGVLVPEIWVAFAEASGIPELKKTTREEPDYDKLMKWRLDILKEHGLGLRFRKPSRPSILCREQRSSWMSFEPFHR